MRRGDHVDALDPGVELAVELGHLELVLEVGDRPQALDDRLGAVVAGELDQQVGEDLHLDVGRSAVASSMKRLALLGGEQRLLLAHRVVDDADDDAVEDLGGAGDDVDVAVGDRVVAARADDGAVRARSFARLRVDGDVGGAVAALAQALQRVDPQRPAGAALDDRPPAVGEQAGQMGVEILPHAVGESIGGIDEDEVEAAPRPRPRRAGQPARRRRRGPARPARRGRGARRCRAPAGCRGRRGRPRAAPRESASIASAPVPQ